MKQILILPVLVIMISFLVFSARNTIDVTTSDNRTYQSDTGTKEI